MLRKCFEFRLYPTQDQAQTMTDWLTTCRYLYNDMLEDRKNAYERCGIGITYYQQAGQLKHLHLDVYSQVAQDVLRRLDRAFVDFFRRVRNSETPGYPRFQGKNRYNSFTYPQFGFKIKDGRLHLVKIGAIRLFQHREIEGKIKTCTIKRDKDRWFASINVELPDPEPKEIKTSVGVDVGLITLATLSDGTEIENPKIWDRYDRKLRRAHRNLSRKKKGSNNRDKQRSKVARIYRKIRNSRKDYLHKTSRTLVDNYDQIIFEDLRIQDMGKNHSLARSIRDASWGTLIRFTIHKAEYAGGAVELVNPRNTSKQCSACGCIQEISRSQRIYRCPDCGLVMGRDHNAAINILNKAVPTDCREFKPVETRQMTLFEAGSPMWG